MATDNHAHYSRIGFTVVLGVVAIAATLVYLGGFHDANSELLVETYYDNSVSGLSVGSPVNLYGVKIGEVRNISFAMSTYYGRGTTDADIRRVVIVMAIQKKMIDCDNGDNGDIGDMIRDHVGKGLRATVISNGITGLSRIELTVVENPQPCTAPGWIPRHPLIPPSPSLFDNFSVAATKLMNRLKTMDFDSVWSNVQRMADAAARTAEKADVMLEGSREGVRQIVTDVGEASASFKELSNTLKDNPSLLIRPSDPEPLPETAR